MPTRSECISKFLSISTHDDLANLYNLGMECQVNVSQDGGERTDGEFKGRTWHGWSDGLTTWKSFRIPYNANTKPEYTDREIKFDLAAHAEGIGMTGWDWKNQCSKWVGYDFDAMMGHAEGLTNEELQQVKDAACEIEWVTVRKSTSGSGLHLYVFLPDIPTSNHHEHAALARSIIGTMSALTGFDFESAVDICGGNMWVWHRKMLRTDGLELIKQGTTLKEVPPNWRDHVKVVTGQRRKNLPQIVEENDSEDLFDELCGQRCNVKLDKDHKLLIDHLKSIEALWWWDQDNHMLVTHTHYLKLCHSEMALKGFFDTNSDATNLDEQNCFCFPLRKGAWSVRRYSAGVREHDSWNQDGGGWTTCYLNKKADLSTASRAYGGIEHPRGGFIFREAEVAQNATRLLGVNLNVATFASGREVKLKQHKDGRLIAEIPHTSNDRADEMDGWHAEKGKWHKVFNAQIETSLEVDAEASNYDDLVRHLVTASDENSGWMLKSDGLWRSEPKDHVMLAFNSLGLSLGEIKMLMGNSALAPWKLVNKPFQSEYPGNREWNRHAAQLKYLPSNQRSKYYPSWTKILNHCGQGLNAAVKANGWCQANGILTGSEYLQCWITSVFKEPNQPLPYLFFFGPQNSGKSIFHEAIQLLLTKGYHRADAALVNTGTFNGELEGAIICVVEETDLRKNNAAYNRIKDWVTSKDLNIHHKGKTPYHVPNTSHWIQCSNDSKACPVFAGDTRITMCYVGEIDAMNLIPKKKLLLLLEKEAPDFLGMLMEVELPESNDRLNVPIVTTSEKAEAQENNQSLLHAFISEKCVRAAGHKIKFSELFSRFEEWLGADDVKEWTKIKVGRNMPDRCPKGRLPQSGQFYVGNLAWSGTTLDEEVLPRLVLKDTFLVPVED